jgi:xanthine dehydrogenase YagR molybdenum-binding subunit
MSIATPPRSAAHDRIEGREKVTGAAKYAYEHDRDDFAYAAIVQSTIAKGTIRSLDASEALALGGVSAVVWGENSPRLHGEGELHVLQTREISYRGQIVAAVVADSSETARQAASLVAVEYDVQPHHTELRADDPDLYKPDKVNPSFDTDSDEGDFAGAFDAAEVKVDATYETPWQHNNPMEPHASLAIWDDEDTLTVYDSSQGTSMAKQQIADTFGLEPDRVRVISPHVGGGFGSKGTPRPLVIVAALAARVAKRPVKIAATRQQMFTLTGYRTPTIQRLRLGAATDGRLTAINHEVVEQTSTVQEFAEQTAVVTRMMYAAPNRRTSHRLAALDVPTPSWMRAPGECPGMFALESALDELAHAAGIDPIELRIRNEPETDPETGMEFSSRNVVACLQAGAAQFGWAQRAAEPGGRRDGDWLTGVGVASSTYPSRRRPSEAIARREADGRYVIQIAAADIGTGARTALTQIAAETLEQPTDRVRLEVGDSALPFAMLAGGSMGTASWGSAVVMACRELRGTDGEAAVHADTSEEIENEEPFARHAFGAQFVEARVNTVTGEIRIVRALGVFAAGRIINPKLARSQFIGGMTMGVGMALLEEGILDPNFGDVVNHDLASYHVATYADVGEIDAIWIDEDDPHLNPMGSKGIGEIGIVGTAAAVANAVFNATGHRFRRVPIRVEDVIEALG